MRKYGQIQCGFWTDPDIRGYSRDAKLIACYLQTGGHSNGLGCYHLPQEYLQADLEMDSETVSKGLAELVEKGFISVCDTTRYVLIHNFLADNPLANGNVAKARQSEFELIPKKACIFKALIQEMLTFGEHWSKDFLNHLETLSKGYAKQEPEPEPEPEPKDTGNSSILDESAKPPDQSQTETSSAHENENTELSITIPLKSDTGAEFEVTTEKIKEFQSLYPSIDVMAELRACRGWNLSNPGRRKSSRGILRHINAWLAKEQKKVQAGGDKKNGTKANGLPDPHASIQRNYGDQPMLISEAMSGVRQ